MTQNMTTTEREDDIFRFFRNDMAKSMFLNKYSHPEGCETWEALAYTLAHEVCGDYLPAEEVHQIFQIIRDMKFIPGGRYLYYAGRPNSFYNNCYLLKAEEDTREDWADLAWKVESCLMTGGGIGVDYSAYRGEGAPIAKTGGVASGPVTKMEITNEQGRRVMQGGSRRSAMYASLLHSHPDIHKFLTIKDWDNLPIGKSGYTYAQAKHDNFDFPCPLDMTNISVNYDDDWLLSYLMTGDVGETFKTNVEQALRTGEPGFSFNFFEKRNETLRNACTEVTSEDDSDVCNLGSLNLSRIDSLPEFTAVTILATKFLLCGTLKADLPYEKVSQVREKNRRLGLGLMGMHEWLLRRGQRYEVTPELHQWLYVYQKVSDEIARKTADELEVSRPVAVRAIAPTGTISLLAATTSGIEPLYAVAVKRRYLRNGDKRYYQYVVDETAKYFIEELGVEPENIETAVDLAKDYHRRIKFQADVQDYVDQAISSTINLPSWGSEHNNPDLVSEFSLILAHFAPRLRGFTCYPDGARGGQPLTSVPYDEAIKSLGVEYSEGEEPERVAASGHTNETAQYTPSPTVEDDQGSVATDGTVFDVCTVTGKGGHCGS